MFLFIDAGQAMAANRFVWPETYHFQQIALCQKFSWCQVQSTGQSSEGVICWGKNSDGCRAVVKCADKPSRLKRKVQTC